MYTHRYIYIYIYIARGGGKTSRCEERVQKDYVAGMMPMFESVNVSKFGGVRVHAPELFVAHMRRMRC